MRQSTANPTVRSDLREWPLDSTIAHLVLLDVHMVPTAETVGGWIEEAFASTRVERIRTSALFPAAADAFLDAGFVEVDRLTLLERALHDRVPVVPPPGLTTARLRTRDLATAADIDAASFPLGWRHDEASLQEITAATPHARRRLVTTTSARRSGRRHQHDAPIGFAITGCAGPSGYIQRLAVRPDARRNGAARLLVADALDWLVRRGARRAMVNTGIDNRAALDLYGDAGFEQLRDELVVVEMTRPT